MTQSGTPDALKLTVDDVEKAVYDARDMLFTVGLDTSKLTNGLNALLAAKPSSAPAAPASEHFGDDGPEEFVDTSAYDAYHAAPAPASTEAPGARLTNDDVLATMNQCERSIIVPAEWVVQFTRALNTLLATRASAAPSTEALSKEPVYKYDVSAIEMLESVRGSLRGYPDTGGDIEVMKEVDRIVKEAVAKTTASTEAPGAPRRVLPGTGEIRNYVWCCNCGKRVSNLTDVEMVVRAWVECPECLEASRRAAPSTEALIAAGDALPERDREWGLLEAKVAWRKELSLRTIEWRRRAAELDAHNIVNDRAKTYRNCADEIDAAVAALHPASKETPKP